MFLETRMEIILETQKRVVLNRRNIENSFGNTKTRLVLIDLEIQKRENKSKKHKKVTSNAQMHPRKCENVSRNRNISRKKAIMFLETGIILQKNTEIFL